MQTTIAMIATLLVILLVGWLARRVIGQRLLGWFEALVARVPLANTIYGSARKLLDILQTKPDGTQRVVLIDFPHTQMKSVGFVTRVVREQGTGRELAAVYVPTTPNPTSGRSEEHTSELQSLMRISYAVFCLKKKKIRSRHINQNKQTRDRR